MSIFDGLGQQDPATSQTDPKRLFRALPKPLGSRFQFPHDIQTEVWDQWFLRRDEPDLVIKMNTGSGKTVVGLVILKSSLNDGKGPAAYLVPNLQLRAQVAATAAELGLLFTEDPDDERFRRGESILIATVQKVFNGLSKFGVRGQGPRSIDLGTVVIDDAHACIPIVRREYSLSIKEGTPAYARLFAVFADSLRGQSQSGFVELEAGEGTHAVPVPFWDWQQHIELVTRVLNESRSHDDLKFNWPLIHEQLALCDAAFTPQELEIRLPYPDLEAIPSFMNAERRVYMTATLADDSVLVTQMGVDPECVMNPIVPGSASDVGDRIILTPLETSGLLTHDDVRAMCSDWAKEHNVVVIVPSRARASSWASVTAEIHDKDTVQDVITRLNRGLVGLVVLVARYDGVDLPNSACRVLVLDGLPEVYSPLERVEASVIGETEAMQVRQVQRIEQGMGRGVRSVDDYCAVLLLDPRLVERLYTSVGEARLSPATRAQYQLSTAFSARGRGKGTAFFDTAVRSFLSRAPEWVQASKQALGGVTYERLSEVPVVAVAERKAFELALSREYVEAKTEIDSALATTSDAKLRGWLKQRAGSYLNRVDAVQANALQRSARKDNSYLLKLPNEAPIVRTTAVQAQATASSGFMREQFESGASLAVAVEADLQDLVPVPGSGTNDRFESACRRLGLLLGFASTRPDKETGVGPDNFWAMGNDHYWLIEAKSGATSGEVSQHYLEQASHHADWFEQGYDDARFSYLLVVIHPSRQPSWDAVPRKGARVMTFSDLAQLREAVRGFASAMSLGEQYREAEAVGRALTEYGLNAGQMKERWTRDFLPAAPKP